MDETRLAEAVLDAYPDGCRPLRTVPLGWAGGLSGASFWRLETPLGTLCLRRWPAGHPDRGRLQFIHDVLRHVQRAGSAVVPLPLETRIRASFVELSGQFWELAPWLPGRADYHEAPSRAKLAAAFTALAEFHVATATFSQLAARSEIAPAVERRLAMLRELAAGGGERLERALSFSQDAALAARAAALWPRFKQLAPTIERELSAAREVVALQPCIRDIHDRHVLFEGHRVTGLIDFGAMRIDHVATDVARLLGTMAGDDAPTRAAAWAAYEQVRPLADRERRLVATLDRANVVLGGIQWLQWLLVERREFERPETVLQRLDLILARLARLTGGSIQSGSESKPQQRL